jgi:inner membrane protein
METTIAPESQSGKTLIKGLITGALILLLLVPTVFIQNLVRERKMRQQEVANEVSSKWAASQTLSGPFLYIPYKYRSTDGQGKPIEVSNYFWVLPDNLQVTGNIDHQVRPRSIYKVLLYRASIQNKGNFILNIPSEIDEDYIQWKDVRICYGLSDFKGIEERMMIKFNGTDNELSPGLPKQDVANMGLSAPVNLTIADIGKNIPFQSEVKIKGSERLHFIPLSGNSSFALQSKWNSPSFDGNNLPSDRNVSDSGFTAKWDFNKANLPFGTVLKNTSLDSNALAFGVTLVQPADQYAKTERTVKYAILIIGLTFSLFFIVEIMQKKPIHPVQYVLIGLALVIFYTLLLSISEFVLFDIAYLLAAVATILLITFYAKGHFQNWRSAGIFGSILTLLYGFIFVLIRLEDTALLVGSIGLFLILSIAMYASRNVKWYGN